MGDGVQTLRELVEADPRARLIAQTYLKRFAAAAGEVLEAGRSFRLVEAGNHCQGCIFLDGADLLTEELLEVFDAVGRKLPEFFVGRYDIRYESDSELRAGRNFKIIELNGAASEATNIYDSSNSIWSAYATLYRQWEIVYRIGAENRRRGNRPADRGRFSKTGWHFPIRLWNSRWLIEHVYVDLRPNERRVRRRHESRRKTHPSSRASSRAF